MSSTSTVSLYSHPQVIKSHSPHSLRSRFLSGSGVLLFAPAAVSVVLVGSARKCGVRFRGLVVRVAASSMADGRGSRRAASGRRVVYRESQAEPAPSPLKLVASVVAPAGVFLAVTFGMNSIGLDWILLVFQLFVIFGAMFVFEFNVNA